MKQIVIAILIVSFIIGLIAVAFTLRQVDREEQRLASDLQYRTTLMADSLRDTVEPQLTNENKETLQRDVNRFSDKQRLAGLVIYNNKGEAIASSSGFLDMPLEAQTVIANAMDSDNLYSQFIKLQDKKTYLFAIPLHKEESVIGAMLIVQNAAFMDSRIEEIWKSNLLRLSIQIVLIVIAIIAMIRWIIYKPLTKLVESIRLSRTAKDPSALPSPSFIFQPLVREVSNMSKSLVEARMAATEEARLRLEKLDSPWTAERLKEFVKELIKERTIFVVSNREPYIHIKTNGAVSHIVPASGMVTAIEPLMQACGGTWIAHGSGNADKLTVNVHDKVSVPPDDPKYSLRRVWLTKKEEEGYYYGFSNEGIWPLSHIAHTRPTFREKDWIYYKSVNGKFAQAVLSEIKKFEKPIILIQDYHFMMLPRIIKNARPDAQIGLFWHIPWPSAESFSICPYKKELLHGMLGADLIGFHTQLHCNNFIDSVGRELESLIDLEQFSIQREKHLSYIKPFPISIAFANGHLTQAAPLRDQDRKKLKQALGIGTDNIGLGVDRLDYTKGILERFLAIEYFLEKNPSFIGNCTFIQISPPTRSEIPRYREFGEQVQEEVDRINRKFKKGGWKPIRLLTKHHSHGELGSYYKIADICLVTSLHDGMNLVAKEFIAERSDEQGVLILSQFAGASRELKDALIVNPYYTEETAKSILAGFTMPAIEQKTRMKKMREIIKKHNVYRWSAEFLQSLLSLE